MVKEGRGRDWEVGGRDGRDGTGQVENGRRHDCQGVKSEEVQELSTSAFS